MADIAELEPEVRLQQLAQQIESAHVSQKPKLLEDFFQTLQEIEVCPLLPDALEGYRQEYIDLCLPSKEFWTEWLQTSVTTRSMEYNVALFAKAQENCADLNVLAIFFGYILGLYEEDKLDTATLREFLEGSIPTCGVDVISGGTFWKILRDFEVEEYDDLIDTSAPFHITKEAKERVIKTFRRQLCLPLVGNEEVLAEFDELLGRIAVESDLSLIDPSSLSLNYNQGLSMREARLGFEYALMSDDYKFVAPEYQYNSYWRPYMELEHKAQEPARVQRLFERALLDCKDHLPCWRDYIEFAMYEVKNWSLVEGIASRAVKAHRSTSALWMDLLNALEVNQRPTEVVSKTSHFALQNVYTSADDYVDLLSFSCDYNRRALQALQSSSKDEVVLALERLRAAFDAAEAFLDAYYPSWTEGIMSICRYRSHVEAEVISDVVDTLPEAYRERYKSQTEKIWLRVVQKFNRNPFIWLECIAWARGTANLDFCRGLYKKAVASVADARELCQQWILFERQCGSLQQLLEAEQRSKPFLKAAPVAAEDTAAEVAKSVPEVHQRRDKRKPDEEVSMEEDADVKKSKLVSTKPTFMKKQKYTVVVKNLSFESTEEEIVEHFSKCQDLLEVKLVLAQGGKFRGIANVDFKSEEGCAAALALHGSMLHGRPIAVEALHKKDSSATAHPTTVFVSKLHVDTTNEDLERHFAECGDIAAAKVMYDKVTGKSKSAALVQFQEEAGKVAALKLNKSALLGAHISVLPSKFPAIVERPKSKADEASMEIDGEEAKEKAPPPSAASTLAFKPRGLAKKAGSGPTPRLTAVPAGSNTAIATANEAATAAPSFTAGAKSNEDFKKMFY